MNWPFITLMSIFEWVLKADINILKELFRNMSDILFCLNIEPENICYLNIKNPFVPELTKFKIE